MTYAKTIYGFHDIFDSLFFNKQNLFDLYDH